MLYEIKFVRPKLNDSFNKEEEPGNRIQERDLRDKVTGETKNRRERFIAKIKEDRRNGGIFLVQAGT